MSCDIIIPVWNQLELIKECIEYIVKNTRYPYRLIIIDNGSQKQTEEYLGELSRNNKLQVTLIRNETNLGYVKAVNQGLRASGADYVCLLNSDTKVSEGWLEELIKVAENNPKIGIVNPGGLPGAYRKKEFVGKWIEIGFATGFCMLIKREVIDKIGLLDEAYEIGFWEDTDFCQRAKRAGYNCVAAKASYVYHHCHRTFEIFKSNRVNELFERNKKLFYSKWGEILRIAWVVNNYTELQRNLNGGIDLVRDGNYIWFFCKNGIKSRELTFEDAQVNEHSDIHFVTFRNILDLVWKITKKRKRCDLIIVKDRFIGLIFSKIGYRIMDRLHKEEILRIKHMNY